MNIKVAIATSDGLNVDLHFGQAKSFLIYELKDGKFEFVEKRELPPVLEPVESTSEDSANGGFGCGSGDGSGCGSGPNGELAPAVKLLLDCQALLVAQVGMKMCRQFERNAISVFDIELPISEALEKLATYYLKLNA